MRMLIAMALTCVPVALCARTEADTSAVTRRSTAVDTSAVNDTSRTIGASGTADSSAVPSPFGALHVTADADSVGVEVDGHAHGAAPATIDSLAPGAHIVHLLPPDPTSWLTAATTDTVVVTAGTTTTRRYAMHRWYAISSVPTGAPVSTDDSLAGITPLLLPADRLTRATRIAIGGEGFKPATATLDDFMRGTLLVRLEPVSPADMPQMLASRELLPDPPSSTGLVISGIASIGFGVAAAYFKGGADRAADQYMVTRDPSLLDERDRMDRGAALAVVGMQVSIGFLTYFLLSR